MGKGRDKKREPAPKIEWRLLARTLQQLAAHRLWFATGIASTIAATALAFAGTYLLKLVTDAAIGGDMRRFAVLVAVSFGAALVGALAGYTQAVSAASLCALATRDLRDRLAKRIQMLPMVTLDRYHSGDLVSRLTSDLSATDAVFRRTPEYVQQPLHFAAGVAFMFVLCPKLALAICAAMPVSVVLFERIVRPMQEHAAKTMVSTAEATCSMQDAIRGASVVRAFNLQEALGLRFQAVVKRIEHHMIERRKRSILAWIPFLMLRYTPQLIVPLYGGYLAYRGEIGIGSLLAFSWLIWSVFLPLESLLAWIREVREASPAMKRYYEILDAAPERQTGGALIPAAASCAVAFEGISFAYGEGPAVLDSVSFRIPVGRTVALVGPSGCGKSTLLRLLCGDVEPRSGRIHVFGQSVSDVNLASLRSHISVVSQDTHLFPGSIAENIAFGKPDATRDEIVAAAKMADAHEFISALPGGYDSPAGELGHRLSGGEKQRICLARALLKDAPILLLDEPTAALDATSEVKVLEAIRRAMRGRTTLLVSHRLSTLRDADEILVLDGGRIRERGTHADLLQADTLYRRFVEQHDAVVTSHEPALEGA